MPEFSPKSRIRDVLDVPGRGRELLYKYGYDVGEAFVDQLSQYQSLEQAARGGRLRGVEQLVEELNATT